MKTKLNNGRATILTISNVPNTILAAIDKLADAEDRSRSSFVRRELARVVKEKGGRK